MEIVLPGPRSRIPGLDFDANGPKIGSTSILTKSTSGFFPPSHEQFDDLLRTHVEGSFDSKHAYRRLAAIAMMLNAGDIALAAIATIQLRLRKTPAPGLDLASLRKAGVNDPATGWPAGTPGGRGGKFRPKHASIAFDPAYEAKRLARLERLKARRGLRAALRRVLTAKRSIRLGLEGLGEAVPVLDAVDTASLIEDLAELSAEIAEENVEVDAATAFVEQGPRALEDLMMSEQEESFSLLEAFQKIDFEKRFGPAGDGYVYHHIVEQASGLTQAELQSTSNIVRIPRLLHEEINAEFMKVDEILGMSLREQLAGASFAERRAAGLDILRKVGVIQP